VLGIAGKLQRIVDQDQAEQDARSGPELEAVRNVQISPLAIGGMA